MTSTVERAASAAPSTGVVADTRDRVGTAARRAYLHHLDLIRATTFSLVIFVHCLTQTTDEWDSVPVNTTSLLLHFTRNTFFALTGFVLMYQNFDKENFRTLTFWRRRIKLVIIPYILWSAIYWIVEDMWVHGRLADIPFSLGEFGRLLVWGLSGFQMYFLFVMLQVYLLFPLVLWLVRKTVGRHWWLLGGSFAVQVAITVAITHWQPPAPISDHWWHHYATFVPYQFFIIYGAVAAVHRQRIGEWLRGKYLWLALALLTTGALAVGAFLYRVWGNGQQPIFASAYSQPTLLPFLVVAIACLYAAAAHWAENWRDFTPRFARVVTYASNRSFSVFLAHVLVLFLILHPQSGGQPWLIETLGQPWATIVAYVGTIGGSLLLVEILRRLPGSLYLTGRPRIALRGRG